MKVYIVTEGEYSDYHIVRVFSTEELATAFADTIKSYDECCVEVYNVNETTPKKVPWTRVLMMRDGEVRNIDHITDWDDTSTEDWAYGDRGSFYVQTDSEERAIKVANVRRAQMIATGEWK